MDILDFYNRTNSQDNEEPDFETEEEVSVSDKPKYYDGDFIVATKQQVKESLETISSKYNDDINAIDLILYFESRDSGYEIKRFLARLSKLVFKDDEEKFNEINRILMDDDVDKFTFAKKSLFIDSVNYYNEDIDDVAGSQEEESSGLFKLDDIDIDDVDIDIDIEDDEDDVLSDTESVFGRDFKYDSVNDYGDDDTDDDCKAPDFEDLINDIVNVTDDDYEETDEKMKDFEESIIDGNDDDDYAGEDILEFENVAEILPVKKFDFKKMPANLSEAQDYYDEIQYRLCNVNDCSGVYFDSSVDNQICENTDIKVNDNIEVIIDFNNEDELNTDICFIVNNEGQVVVLGSFIGSSVSNQYFIEADERNIDFRTMHHSDMTFNIIIFNKKCNHFYISNIEINIVEKKTTDTTLCIDFGTSNTTAGIYTNDGIKIVNFTDTTSIKHMNSKLCPTIVYIKNIVSINETTGEATDVDYLFGYDANQVLINKDYNPEGDMFFEIKRWIVTPNKLENICDGKKRAKIRRKEIIKAYLHYILKCAENDLKMKFKKLHFSAPIKLKSDFIAFLKENVFTENDGYMVLGSDDSIDEGVAIVYNNIAENIIETDREYSKKDKQSDVYDEDTPDKEENIVIIDCGGGTTDLANCHYSYKHTETAYELTLETKFENGNSNFGGNNITYRIFELLKIKIADYYNNKYHSNNINANNLNVSISDLINANMNDVLNKIDECIKTKSPITIYNKLDAESAKSENILPTDFNGDSVYAKKANTRRLIKRNFYYLWQLAEKIKIEFFTKAETLSISLDKSDKISVNPDTLYFYIVNPYSALPPMVSTKELDKDDVLPQINVNTNEIANLIRPDIYYLLATIFFNDGKGDTSDYDRIKDIEQITLSGQSCKINLFQDLLKEFIPGYKLRFGRNYRYETAVSEKLKLDCVKGCIAYIRDKEYHAIKTQNILVSQNLTYDVFISRGNSGIMTDSLFKANDFTSENGILKANPIHIEQYDACAGNIRIVVYNTVGTYEKEYEITVPIEYKKEKQIHLDHSYGSKSLKEKIIEYSYNKIEEYNVYSSDGSIENSVINKLIDDFESISVTRGHDKVLVFALPNSDGYGFILYQILKSLDLNNNEVYYETSSKRIPFESCILSKSFFNGRNFVDIK